MFAIGLAVLIFFVSGWMDGIVSWLPSWLSGITWVLWVLFILLFWVAVFVGFYLLANFIAATFNGLLAEKVQLHLTGQDLGESGLGAIMASIPRSLGREISKLTYYLPRLLVLLVLSAFSLFIPVLNVIVALLWLVFGAWMMVIQYIDYPMDNNGLSFLAMRRSLNQQRLLHLGFGGGVSILLMIPLLNFFAMPIAVAGATALYVAEHEISAIIDQ